MADLTLAVNGTPVPVYLGESGSLAELQAAAAALSAAAAAASASAAAASEDAASGFSSIAEAGLSWYDTKSAATAALAGIAANAVVGVLADESQSGHRTLYRKVGGVLVLKATLDAFDPVDFIGFTPPDASHTYMTVRPFDSDNPNFHFNISDTVNPGNASRPNAVMNFGWNLNPGGGPVVAGKGLFGMGFEGHYEPTTNESYWEWHIYAGFEEDGTQRRPDSMRLDKNSDLAGGWVRLMRFNGINFTGPKKTTPFVQWSETGLDFRPVQDGSGEPTDGFSFSANPGASNRIELTKVGGTAADFAIVGFDTIVLPGNLSWDTHKFFFNNGDGQGAVGSWGGFFQVIHQQDIKIGKYGGSTGILIDNTTADAAVIPNLPTYANNAAAVAGSWPTGALYKTATGEVRVVV